jgi:Leucine-rich repeat (LRR) protein
MNLNLNHSRICFFPDLSNLQFEEVRADYNNLAVIPEDFLPRGIKRVSFVANNIRNDGLPVVFPDTVEEILVDKNGLRDFCGVDHFPSHLKKISANYMNIDTFTKLDHDSLEDISIHHAVLTSVGLLPHSLQRLNLSNNNISMMPNRFPMNIRHVDLSNNRLHFAGLPSFWGNALEELHLDLNKIDRFPKNLPSTLLVLTLGVNRIKEVPSLQHLPNLKTLGLYKNKIKHITIEYRRKPIVYVNLRVNHLTYSAQEINRQTQQQWALNIEESDNWNTEKHQSSVRKIQKNWRVSRIRNRIRTWKRTGVLREELMCVSMMPERVWQTDIISPEWKRPIS